MPRASRLRTAPASSGLAAKPVGGELDRRREQLLQRHRAEPGVERDPPVDAAGHGDRTDVVTERHRVQAVVADRVGARTRAGTAGRVQRHHTLRCRDEREQVAAHAAQVRADHGHHGVRRDRGVDRVAARSERADAGERGGLVGGSDGAARAAHGGGGRSDHVRTVGAYHRHVPNDRRTGAIVLTIGAAVTLVGTFLGWVGSGARTRSSYQIFGLVDRLGFAPNGVVGWLLRLWPLVPLALVVTVIAHWAHHPSLRWPRHGITGAALLYPGVTAIAVANAPDIGLFRVGPGPLVTVVGAALMLAGLLTPWALSAIRRARSGAASTPAGDPS